VSDDTTSLPFPGPTALGRGVVVEPGDPLPEGAEAWPSLVVDAAALADPTEALATLDGWWRRRHPSVVVLAVPFSDLKAPEAHTGPIHALRPAFEFERERLHFLIWVNRYDARGGTIRWHHRERAVAAGALSGGETADLLVEGRPAWVDGGPRGHHPGEGLEVVHVESVWSGRVEPDRPAQATGAGLAPDQLAAVQHQGGPARVIAPAGSGKTRVLTERLRHLVAERGWNPDAITALAYNRRAAGEMQERLADAGPTHVRTLHAFGYELVGRARGGRPRLLGEWEVRRMLEDFAPVRPRANEDVYAPYLEALAEVRMVLRDPDEVEAGRDDVPGLAQLFEPWRQALRRSGAMDHDEQIYGAIEALVSDPALRSWAQARCRHLLVDEFQDLTPAQLLLVRLLAAPGYDVFGVGDDDQVIYGHAGATPEFLIDYHRFFPGADHHELQVNYRCPAPVVEAAVTLLTHNRRRVPKEIRPPASKDPSPPSTLAIRPALEADLGRTLVETVSALVERDGPRSVAVLSRVNVGLLVPQIALREAGVPARPVLDRGLLGRSGVRAAMAWLRLASASAEGRPMEGSDLSEAVRRPPRSLSPGVRSALGRGVWTLDRLASFAAGSDDARTRTRLEGLVDDIVAVADLVRDGESVADQLTIVRDTVGLGSVLDRLDNSRARPTGGHSDDLDALIVLAHSHPEVDAFETWLQASLEAAEPTDEGVTLSTVHRVKGLEWPHVVVWDATTGIMPHRLADDIEEERRVFHVALTRCSQSVTVIGRRDALSPFVAQLSRAATPAEQEPPPPERGAVEGQEGLAVVWQGFRATIVDLDDQAAVIRVGSASRMRIPWGEAVTVEGRRARLVAPSGPAPDDAVLGRLKEWRRSRASTDGVPPYVVAHDAHLESIAVRLPSSLEELARCEGIGPSRLDRYGDDILAVVGG
jgi:DNA helicase II / ATP-dependent DNA helicase PcrA